MQGVCVCARTHVGLQRFRVLGARVNSEFELRIRGAITMTAMLVRGSHHESTSQDKNAFD